MDIKRFEDFSARDQLELTKMLEEMQKLKPPRRRPDDPEVYFDHYEFYLGRGKQFRIVRIK